MRSEGEGACEEANEAMEAIDRSIDRSRVVIGE